MDSEESSRITDESDEDDFDYLAGFDLDKEVEGYLENLKSIPIELFQPNDDKENIEITLNKNKEEIEQNLYNLVRQTIEAQQQKMNSEAQENIDSEDENLYRTTDTIEPQQQNINLETYEKMDSEDENLYRTTENIEKFEKCTEEKNELNMNEDNSICGLEAISDNDLDDDVESGECYSDEEDVFNKSDPRVVDMDISDGEADVNARPKPDGTSLNTTVPTETSMNTVPSEQCKRNMNVLNDYCRKCNIYISRLSKIGINRNNPRGLKTLKSAVVVPKTKMSEPGAKLGMIAVKKKMNSLSVNPGTSFQGSEDKHKSNHKKIKKYQYNYLLPEKVNKKHKHYKKYVDYVKKEYKKKRSEHKKSLKKTAKLLEKKGLIAQNLVHTKISNKKKEKVIKLLSYSEFCKSRELSPDIELESKVSLPPGGDLQKTDVSKSEKEIELLNLNPHGSSSVEIKTDNEQVSSSCECKNDGEGELFVTFSELVKQNAFDNDPRMQGLSVFQQALFKIRPSKGIPFLQDDIQVREKIISPTKQQPPTSPSVKATVETDIKINEKKDADSSVNSPKHSFHNKALSKIISRALSSDKKTSGIKPNTSTSTTSSKSRSRSPYSYKRKNSLRSSSKSPVRSRTPPKAYRRRSRSKSSSRERKKYKRSSSPEFKHHVVYKSLSSMKRSRSRSRSWDRPVVTRSRSRSRHRYKKEYSSSYIGRSKYRSRSRSRSRSREQYHYRSPPPKNRRPPPPSKDRRSSESERRYIRRTKSPDKTFADQLRGKLRDKLRDKLREENERALAMLRKTIDQSNLIQKASHEAAENPTQSSSSPRVSSVYSTENLDKNSRLSKQYRIFKPSDLDCILQDHYSRGSSSGSPSSRSEKSVSPKHQLHLQETETLSLPEVPDLSVPPPGITVPLPSITVPPPGISVPPPGITVPTLGISVPPPGITVPPPGITVPPPGVTVLPPGITSALPPVPTSAVKPLEEKKEQAVVTTYSNYVPFVNPTPPNILPPTPPESLTPYINPELGHYQYTNYMIPQPTIPPPHMFPPQFIGRFDPEMVMRPNINQPHFSFINQQPFHYPMGMPQFPNALHNPFNVAVSNQPQKVSIVDMSKQSTSNTGNHLQWLNEPTSVFKKKKLTPQITWPQNMENNQILDDQLEAGLKKNQTFLDPVISDVRKDQNSVSQIEGGAAHTSNFKTICCVHNHFKSSDFSLKTYSNRIVIKEVTEFSTSKQNKNVSDMIDNVGDKWNKKRYDVDNINIIDLVENSDEENNKDRTDKPVNIADVDGNSLEAIDKISFKTTEIIDLTFQSQIVHSFVEHSQVSVNSETEFDEVSTQTKKKLPEFGDNVANDAISEIKFKNEASNPSYRKKINLENKINKLIQGLNSTSSSVEDSKKGNNHLMDNTLADEESKKGNNHLMDNTLADEDSKKGNNHLMDNTLADEDSKKGNNHLMDNTLADEESKKGNNHLMDNTLADEDSKKGNNHLMDNTLADEESKQGNNHLMDNTLADEGSKKGNNHLMDNTLANEDSKKGNNHLMDNTLANEDSKKGNNHLMDNTLANEDSKKGNNHLMDNTLADEDSKKGNNHLMDNTLADEESKKANNHLMDNTLADKDSKKGNNHLMDNTLADKDSKKGNNHLMDNTLADEESKKANNHLMDNTLADKDSKKGNNHLMDNTLADKDSKKGNNHLMDNTLADKDSKKANNHLMDNTLADKDSKKGNNHLMDNTLADEESKKGNNHLIDNTLADEESKNSFEKSITENLQECKHLDGKLENVQDITKPRNDEKENEHSISLSVGVNTEQKKQLTEENEKSNENDVISNNENENYSAIDTFQETLLNKNEEDKNYNNTNDVKIVEENMKCTADSCSLNQNKGSEKFDTANCLTTLETESDKESSLINQLSVIEDSIILLEKDKVKIIDTNVAANKGESICTNDSEIQLSSDASFPIAKLKRREREIVEDSAIDITEKKQEGLRKHVVETTLNNSTKLLHKKKTCNREDVTKEIRVKNVDTEIKNKSKSENKKLNTEIKNKSRSTKNRKTIDKVLEVDQTNIETDQTKDQGFSSERRQLMKIPSGNKLTLSGSGSSQKNITTDFALHKSKKNMDQTPSTTGDIKELDKSKKKDVNSKQNVIKTDKNKESKNNIEKVQNTESESSVTQSGVKISKRNIQEIHNNMELENSNQKENVHVNVLLSKRTRSSRKNYVELDKLNATTVKNNAIAKDCLKLSKENETEDNESAFENYSTTVKINTFKNDLFPKHLNKKSDSQRNTFYFPKEKNSANSSKYLIDLPLEKPCPLSKKSLHYINQNFLAQRAAEEEEHQSVVKGLKLKTLKVKLSRVNYTETPHSTVLPKASTTAVEETVGVNKRKVSAISKTTLPLYYGNINTSGINTRKFVKEGEAIVSDISSNFSSVENQDIHPVFDESDEYFDNNGTSDIVICDVFSMSEVQGDMLSQNIELDDLSESKTSYFVSSQVHEISVNESFTNTNQIDPNCLYENEIDNCKKFLYEAGSSVNEISDGAEHNSNFNEINIDSRNIFANENSLSSYTGETVNNKENNNEAVQKIKPFSSVNVSKNKTVQNSSENVNENDELQHSDSSKNTNKESEKIILPFLSNNSNVDEVLNKTSLNVPKDIYSDTSRNNSSGYHTNIQENKLQRSNKIVKESECKMSKNIFNKMHFDHSSDAITSNNSDFSIEINSANKKNLTECSKNRSFQDATYDNANILIINKNKENSETNVNVKLVNIDSDNIKQSDTVSSTQYTAPKTNISTITGKATFQTQDIQNKSLDNSGIVGNDKLVEHSNKANVSKGQPTCSAYGNHKSIQNILKSFSKVPQPVPTAKKKTMLQILDDDSVINVVPLNYYLKVIERQEKAKLKKDKENKNTLEKSSVAGSIEICNDVRRTTSENKLEFQVQNKLSVELSYSSENEIVNNKSKGCDNFTEGNDRDVNAGNISETNNFCNKTKRKINYNQQMIIQNNLSSQNDSVSISKSKITTLNLETRKNKRKNLVNIKNKKDKNCLTSTTSDEIKNIHDMIQNDLQEEEFSSVTGEIEGFNNTVSLKSGTNGFEETIIDRTKKTVTFNKNTVTKNSVAGEINTKTSTRYEIKEEELSMGKYSAHGSCSIQTKKAKKKVQNLTKRSLNTDLINNKIQNQCEGKEGTIETDKIIVNNCKKDQVKDTEESSKYDTGINDKYVFDDDIVENTKDYIVEIKTISSTTFQETQFKCDEFNVNLPAKKRGRGRPRKITLQPCPFVPPDPTLRYNLRSSLSSHKTSEPASFVIHQDQSLQNTVKKATRHSNNRKKTEVFNKQFDASNHFPNDKVSDVSCYLTSKVETKVVDSKTSYNITPKKTNYEKGKKLVDFKGSVVDDGSCLSFGMKCEELLESESLTGLASLSKDNVSPTTDSAKPNIETVQKKRGRGRPRKIIKEGTPTVGNDLPSQNILFSSKNKSKNIQLYENHKEDNIPLRKINSDQDKQIQLTNAGVPENSDLYRPINLLKNSSVESNLFVDKTENELTNLSITVSEVINKTMKKQETGKCFKNNGFSRPARKQQKSKGALINQQNDTLNSSEISQIMKDFLDSSEKLCFSKNPANETEQNSNENDSDISLFVKGLQETSNDEIPNNLNAFEYTLSRSPRPSMSVQKSKQFLTKTVEYVHSKTLKQQILSIDENKNEDLNLEPFEDSVDSLKHSFNESTSFKNTRSGQVSKNNFRDDSLNILLLPKNSKSAQETKAISSDFILVSNNSDNTSKNSKPLFCESRKRNQKKNCRDVVFQTQSKYGSSDRVTRSSKRLLSPTIDNSDAYDCSTNIFLKRRKNINNNNLASNFGNSQNNLSNINVFLQLKCTESTTTALNTVIDNESTAMIENSKQLSDIVKEDENGIEDRSASDLQISNEIDEISAKKRKRRRKGDDLLTWDYFKDKCEVNGNQAANSNITFEDSSDKFDLPFTSNNDILDSSKILQHKPDVNNKYSKKHKKRISAKNILKGGRGLYDSLKEEKQKRDNKQPKQKQYDNRNVLEYKTPPLANSPIDNAISQIMPISSENSLITKRQETESSVKQKNYLKKKGKKQTEEYVFKAECSIKLDSFVSFSEFKSKYKDLQAKIRKLKSRNFRSTVDENDNDSDSIYGGMDIDDMTSSDKFSGESYICTSKMSLTENKILIVKQAKLKPSVTVNTSHETHKDMVSTIIKPQVRVSDSSISLQETPSTIPKYNSHSKHISNESSLKKRKNGREKRNLNSSIEAKVKESIKKTQKSLKLKKRGKRNKFNKTQEKEFSENKCSSVENDINSNLTNSFGLDLDTKIEKNDLTDMCTNSVVDDNNLIQRVDIEFPITHNSSDVADESQIQTCESHVKTSGVNCSGSTSETLSLPNTSTDSSVPQVISVQVETELYNKMSDFQNLDNRTMCTQVKLLNKNLRGEESVENFSKMNFVMSKVNMDNILKAFNKIRQLT